MDDTVDIPRVQKFVTTRSGLRLWTEAFGDCNDPPVLLIMGGMAQGIMWHDSFCRNFAAAGYFVVRYDHRDTGYSTTVDITTVPYDLTDLAADAAAVTATVIGGPAHVVGQSAGGLMAQLLAIDHPTLVRSLVLLSSFPDVVFGPGPVSFPDSGESPCPTTAQTDLDREVEGWQGLVGSNAPFDQRYWRELLTCAAARADRPDRAANHQAALARTPSYRARLNRITVSTLVIHGRHDPLSPIDNGRALAAAIPGATLIELDNLGHFFPPEWIHRILDPILRHLRRQRSAIPAASRQRIGVVPEGRR